MKFANHEVQIKFSDLSSVDTVNSTGMAFLELALSIAIHRRK